MTLYTWFMFFVLVISVSALVTSILALSKKPIQTFVKPTPSTVFIREN